MRALSRIPVLKVKVTFTQIFEAFLRCAASV